MERNIPEELEKKTEVMLFVTLSELVRKRGGKVTLQKDSTSVSVELDNGDLIYTPVYMPRVRNLYDCIEFVSYGVLDEKEMEREFYEDEMNTVNLNHS